MWAACAAPAEDMNQGKMMESKKMAKIVYNACYGGFGLSKAAMERYIQLKALKLRWVQHDKIPEWGYWAHEDGKYFHEADIQRNDPVLVQIVEEMGDDANDHFSKLAIRELPDGTEYRIEDYDGYESVHTRDSYGWNRA
jgi:hypothetical protein